ncbi:MAG: ATPase AAA [Parcubacteria group bacterium Gr01-1014_70]|nr:MAG: ATPase AAA [Parcubacteria group bacterium Gr01-1014_70]
MLQSLLRMTQEDALSILKTGANVFLTGAPGSGKTHTINTYVTYLRSYGIEPAITASTGIAATHINGMTIHSWSGIGVKNELTEYDLEHISQNERVARRVTRAKVLIIDEVSMLSAQTLSMVDEVCQEVRRTPHAFGGLQVVLVGDFFQLPPIVRHTRADEQEIRLAFENALDNPRAQFAYHSQSWTGARAVVCYLTEQHRQEDTTFLGILSALRGGFFKKEHEMHLMGRRVVKETEHKGITKLFSHNADVDRVNEVELKKLSGLPRAFEMRTHGTQIFVDQLKRSCLSPERLLLKIGAKVMFTKNSLEGRFVNGTTGEVVRFDTTHGFPMVKIRSGRTIFADPAEWAMETDGRVLASITQVPLRLAWAITVHKSQGMSLDTAFIDLTQAFEYGQGYVALSRVRTLAGLYLRGWNSRALEVHPDVRAKDAAFRRESELANEAFQAINTKEISAMHANFICACGGNFIKSTDKKPSTKVHN